GGTGKSKTKHPRVPRGLLFLNTQVKNALTCDMPYEKYGISHMPPPQNWMRAESCRLRGGRTAVTAPKPVGLPNSEARLVGVVAPSAPLNVALTSLNCVWLSALKASRRNSNPAFSLIRKRFASDRSKALIGER